VWTTIPSDDARFLLRNHGFAIVESIPRTNVGMRQITAIAELAEPPRIVTSVPRACVVCGFTTVTSNPYHGVKRNRSVPKSLPACRPGRLHGGAEKIVRNDAPPWWPAYIRTYGRPA